MAKSNLYTCLSKRSKKANQSNSRGGGGPIEFPMPGPPTDDQPAGGREAAGTGAVHRRQGRRVYALRRGARRPGRRASAGPWPACRAATGSWRRRRRWSRACDRPRPAAARRPSSSSAPSPPPPMMKPRESRRGKTLERVCGLLALPIQFPSPFLFLFPLVLVIYSFEASSGSLSARRGSCRGFPLVHAKRPGDDGDRRGRRASRRNGPGRPEDALVWALTMGRNAAHNVPGLLWAFNSRRAGPEIVKYITTILLLGKSGHGCFLTFARCVSLPFLSLRPTTPRSRSRASCRRRGLRLSSFCSGGASPSSSIIPWAGSGRRSSRNCGDPFLFSVGRSPSVMRILGSSNPKLPCGGYDGLFPLQGSVVSEPMER